jgi:hypothetical protein
VPGDLSGYARRHLAAPEVRTFTPEVCTFTLEVRTFTLEVRTFTPEVRTFTLEVRTRAMDGAVTLLSAERTGEVFASQKLQCQNPARTPYFGTEVPPDVADLCLVPFC